MKWAALALVILTSCQSNDFEGDCVFDADCAAAEACEGQVCVPTCVADDECAEGLVCGPGVNTTARLCRRQNEWDEPANSFTPESDGRSDGWRAAVITSATTIAATSDCGTTQPGPDIIAVAVEDRNGQPLAWAQVEFSAVDVTNNEHANSSVLDGEAPQSGSAGCPEMSEGHVVSLGCDGAHVVVSFTDEDGADFEFDRGSGLVLRVYEWGGQCEVGASEDTYSVRLCRDADRAFRGDISSCSDSVIEDGTGERSASLD